MELGQMDLALRQHGPGDPELPAILDLIQTAFAYMEGVIDPPSSMRTLTLDALCAQATTGEIWSVGPPLAACVFLTPQPQALYVSKLAVAGPWRGQGLARRLIDQAVLRARHHQRPALDLQSRVELTGNHAAFAAMGFVETGRSSHPGYSRPTSITFRRALA
jgi:ribosomal protein S18 acetylase RimI-like enzyme